MEVLDARIFSRDMQCSHNYLAVNYLTKELQLLENTLKLKINDTHSPEDDDLGAGVNGGGIDWSCWRGDAGWGTDVCLFSSFFLSSSLFPASK